MIKQTITYTDFNDTERTEDFYFHMTKEEILEMEISYDGGLSNYIEQLTKVEAGREAYALFKEIFLRAYGKKSADGRQFWKEDPDTGRKYSKEFVASPAMSELVFSFLEDADSASRFVSGLLPKGLVEEAEREAAKRQAAGKDDGVVAVAPEPVKPTISAEKTLTDFTRQELLDMPQAQFDKLAGTDPTKMDQNTLVVAMQRKTQNGA